MTKDRRTGNLAKIKVGDEVYISKRHGYHTGTCEKITPSGQMTISYGTTSKKFTPSGNMFGSNDPWRSPCVRGLLSDYLEKVQFFRQKDIYNRTRASIRALANNVPHANSNVGEGDLSVIQALVHQTESILNRKSQNTHEYTVAVTDIDHTQFVFHTNVTHAIEEFIEDWSYDQFNHGPHPQMGSIATFIVYGVHNEFKPSIIFDSGEVIEDLADRLCEDFDVDMPHIRKKSRSFDDFLDVAFAAWLWSSGVELQIGALSNNDERQDLLAHITWPHGFDEPPAIKTTVPCAGPSTGSRLGKCTADKPHESNARYFVASSFIAPTSTANLCR